ncbi:MAG TPA: hypothetical protein VJ673_06480 [Aromatoleum sp.]|uniref:hypothetical protein n=1 Tax=Aromatoleum sp. TaxID=2307007 RepID=UPI002B4A7225|nr:hypothetical protein [Aromatoleum sp.]HJV25312.1 hypothetical protein [Aromatoleum sp.]
MAVLKFIGGILVAILGYALARRILDRVGLEHRFTDRIWRYTLSQFGEIILAIMTVVIFLTMAAVYELIRVLVAGA